MIHRFISLLILFALLSACGGGGDYTYRAPESTADGLRTGSLGEVGMDSVLIRKFITRIQEGYLDYVDAILVLKNDKLVLEEYFNGYGRETQHNLMSCTKAVTAAAVGIAVDKGFIKSDSDSLVTYLGPYRKLRNEHINKITISHVLEMSTGFEWVGDFSQAGRELPLSSDMVKYVLELPVEAGPGLKFNYSSANSILLSPVILNATGKQVDEFAKENLFDKLGITNYQWDKLSEFLYKTDVKMSSHRERTVKYDSAFSKLSNTATGLWMIPRDMVKLGMLHLNGGVWNGEQILSKSWVEKSTKERIPKSNYGYAWRMKDIARHQTIYASGFGVQRIFLIPEMSMVVVTTQSWFTDQNTGVEQMDAIMINILSAVN